MRKEVTREELAALLATRWVLSPGGAGVRLGRERSVMSRDTHKPHRGLLAWERIDRQRRLPRVMQSYVDGGWRDPEDSSIPIGITTIPFDPHAWDSDGRDPDAIISEALRRYAKMLNRMVEERSA